MLPILTTSTLETVVRCRIAASSVVRASATDVEAMRRQPLIIGGEKHPNSLLKHADGQTITALKAVLQAREILGETTLTDWGVIAAPDLFGRVSIAQTVHRFQKEGAWGVSPHLIPHQSLHAVSGTVSQVLKIHGPNFGISGGPNGAPDAFLVAASMMMDGALPGLWLILSGYETEWIPAADGNHPAAPTCVAVAWALTPRDRLPGGLHISIVGSGKEDGRHLPELDLAALAEETPRGKWRISESHRVEIEP